MTDLKIDDLTSNATWQDKAEWLRINGYGLSLHTLDGEDGYKWMATAEGGGREYAPTIGEAVELIYKRVTQSPYPPPDTGTFTFSSDKRRFYREEYLGIALYACSHNKNVFIRCGTVGNIDDAEKWLKGESVNKTGPDAEVAKFREWLDGEWETETEAYKKLTPQVTHTDENPIAHRNKN